jgi:enamine deaminase RidA (YjgF/YER057c/UK114 family)
MRGGQKGPLPKPLHPEGWPRPRGYSYGFSARGTIVVLSGIVGWNREGLFESDDFVAQARQALLNILEILRVAGGHREHLVRLTWYVTDMREYLNRTEDLGKAYRSVMGSHYPPLSKALEELRSKMALYLKNGVRLGVLVDPYARAVEVYRPQEEPLRLQGVEAVSLEPELPGFALWLPPLW